MTLHAFEGKTIRSIDSRQGGEQVIIYFEDDSFIIFTAEVRGDSRALSACPVGEITYQCRDCANDWPKTEPK